MYNYRPIEKIIVQANEEAELAAQKVYDKFQPLLERAILNQIKAGDIVYIGMGVASMDKEINEDFIDTIASTQYNRINVGFNLPDISK